MIRVTNESSGETAQLESAHHYTAHHYTAHHYTLAGQRIVFQQRVAALDAFDEGPASSTYNEMLHKLPQIRPLQTSTAKLKYRGEAPFGGQMREVECWVSGPIMQIDISGQPSCMIHPEQKHIHLLSQAPYDDRINLEVVTGPALMLMLAFLGIYCLHAGCVQTEYGRIALIAESGTGKSTLSQHVDQQWRQLADDVLPLKMVDSMPLSKYGFELRRYPQLKLPGAQTAGRIRETDKLDLILRLSNREVNEVEFTPLFKTTAMLEIIRHTVAAKLFSNSMMRDHARFAKRLSSAVPVVELAYPRELEQLPELRQQIQRYLQTTHQNIKGQANA